jgi:membrane protease YdiL (CAAX protease family)
MLTSKVVSTVIWQFIFSGFGEEILYRGYFQSRINEEFGRPHSFLGVNFGIGLIIASLLFAMAHVLNPFNPFKGSFDLFWGWGLWTSFGGLFFGFIREKTGSILAAGIAHGLPDAFGEAIAQLSSFL